MKAIMDIFLEKKRTLLIVFLYVIIIVYSTRTKKRTGWEIYRKTINAALFEARRRIKDKRKLKKQIKNRKKTKQAKKNDDADYPL